MNTPSSAADQYAPLPGRETQGFALFFHAVFIVGLGISLALYWSDARGGMKVLLPALMTIQVALYLLLFALPGHARRWSNGRWLALYYLGSLAIFFIECRINSVFYWLIGPYLAHVLVLPWRVAAPATIGLFGGFFLVIFGWSGLAKLTAFQWFIALGAAAAWCGVLLFLHRAVATSSERGKLIRALETAKHELELARQRDAELAALRERERLARDLHDSLGHSVVTLTVQLEAAERLVATDPARATKLLAEMQTLTRSSMDGLRRSLANLRAPGLGERPLAEALRSLCADVQQRSRMKIECHVDDGLDHLPPVVAEALWRVAQEGLTNVEKHAQALRTTVSVLLQPGELVLRVSDDGIGAPAEAEQRPGHYGVRGMRERIEGLGGTFALAANGSSGTLLEARVPLIA